MDKQIILHTADESILFERKINPPAPGTYIPKDRGLRVDFSKGDWWRCRHDFERTAFGYNPPKYGLPRQRAVQGYSQLKPMPQTVMTWQLPRSDGGFTPFTQEWQFRYYELLEWAIDGRLERGERTGRYWKKINGKKVFGPYDSYSRVEYTPYSMMGVWEDTVSDSVGLTDGHSFDNGLADYVQLLNLSAQPMQIKRLLFGGTALRKMGLSDKYTIFETLDPTQHPPTLQWIIENKPYLIQWTTEIGCLEEQKLADGRWVVAMFGKFKPTCDYFGLARVGVPYFIFGRGGTNLVLTEHIIPMETEAYSMYVPEKY